MHDSQSYQHLEYEVADGVASLFLNRPQKKNAYIPMMGEDIVAAMQSAMTDDAVRVVLLAGRGNTFCAGVDLDFLKAHMAGESTGEGPALGTEHLVNAWPLDLVDYPKPVIVAMHGAAFGVGVTMTLGCDVRYVEQGTKLGLNFTSLGVLPGLGSTHHLPRLVGAGKAMELVLSGATLSAEEAVDIGLAQKLCAPGAVYADARALALSMAAKQPAVLAAARRALRSGAESSLAAAIDLEKALSAELRKGRSG